MLHNHQVLVRLRPSTRIPFLTNSSDFHFQVYLSLWRLNNARLNNLTLICENLRHFYMSICICNIMQYDIYNIKVMCTSNFQILK